MDVNEELKLLCKCKKMGGCQVRPVMGVVEGWGLVDREGVGW